MPQVQLKNPISLDQMRARITPVIAADGEVIPWVWYDQATYTSGTTTSLSLFDTVRADKVTGNMEAAGQIPAPMFFQLYHLGVHPLIPPLAESVASMTLTDNGAFEDLHNLILGSATLNVAQKQYFRSPIFLCPSGGGASGVITVAAAGSPSGAGAHVKYSYAVNGKPDLRNRNQFWGMIVIPHNQTFAVTLDWSAAITLAAGSVGIRCYLDGYLYRRVL